MTRNSLVFNDSHVLHRKTLGNDMIFGKLPSRFFKPFNFLRQQLFVYFLLLSFHLEKRHLFVNVIRCNNVYFVFALAVPPAVNMCILFALLHYLLEVLFQHFSAIGLIVTSYYFLQLFVGIRFYEIVVFINESKPKLQE